MRNGLLITTAIAALIAGTSLAAAKERGAEQSAMPEHKGALQQKGQKGAEQRGAAEEQRGSMRKGGEPQKGSMQKNAEHEKASPQKAAEPQNGAAGKSGTVGQSSTQERSSEQSGRTTGQGAAGTQGERSQAASVQLSQDQRTRIKQTIIVRHEARVDNPTFSISVGARVPPRVHGGTLPEEVIRIVPQYRGFDYIVARDEILIIDPATFEIVAIIPA